MPCIHIPPGFPPCPGCLISGLADSNKPYTQVKWTQRESGILRDKFGGALSF